MSTFDELEAVATAIARVLDPVMAVSEHAHVAGAIQAGEPFAAVLLLGGAKHGADVSVPDDLAERLLKVVISLDDAEDLQDVRELFPEVEMFMTTAA